MLTLDPALKASLSNSTVKPVVMVSLLLNGTWHRFTNTMDHLLPDVASASVSSFQPVVSEIDVISRRFSRAGYSIELVADTHLRLLMSAYPLKNADLIIDLGTGEITEAQFSRMASCLVLDYRINDGIVTIEAKPKFWALLDESEAEFNIVNKHPLEVLEAILVHSEIPTSYYDANSMDPTSYPELEHWNISFFPATINDLAPVFGSTTGGVVAREFTRAMKKFKDESSSTLVDSCAEILSGVLRPDDDGVQVFTRLDLEAASIRTLSGDDLSDFQQVSVTENYATEVVTVVATNGGLGLTFTLRNSASAFDANLFTGATGEHTIATRLDGTWLNQLGLMYATPVGGTAEYLADDSPTFIVADPTSAGFCGQQYTGNASPYSPHSSTTARRLSATNYAYLMLVGGAGRTYEDTGGAAPIQLQESRDEIIRVSASTVLDDIASNATGIVEMPIYNSDEEVLYYPKASITYTIDTSAPNGGRDQFPLDATLDVPERWRGGVTEVVDVTIPVDMAQKILTRCAYGVPKVEFMATLEHADLQPGDVVQLEHDEVVGFGINGSDLGVWWEVLATELRILDDSPGVKITLGYLRGVNLTTIAVRAPPVFERPGSRPVAVAFTPFVLELEQPLTQNDLEVIQEDGTLETMFPG